MSYHGIYSRNTLQNINCLRACVGYTTGAYGCHISETIPGDGWRTRCSLFPISRPTYRDRFWRLAVLRLLPVSGSPFSTGQLLPDQPGGYVGGITLRAGPRIQMAVFSRSA